ncbi:MAG: hypothetical protein ACXV3C_00335 [Actinomycetes bacterium]
MDEQRAFRVVDALRAKGLDARMEKAGVYTFGIAVRVSGGRTAVWDSDGTLGLEAQVMADGVLVGYVPVIEGSEDFDDEQVVQAILQTDYDKPVATRRATPAPPAAPLPPEGGVFRRFLGGFRHG